MKTITKLCLATCAAATVFNGCATKTESVYIDIYAICKTPQYTLYLNDISVENLGKTVNISKYEAKNAIISNLKSTGCFNIIEQESVDGFYSSSNEYAFRAKVSSIQENIVTNDTFISKEVTENILVGVTLFADSGSEKIQSFGKGKNSFTKPNILGFEKEVNRNENKLKALDDATKASIKEFIKKFN